MKEILNIKPEDLLGRLPVQIDTDQVSKLITGRRVMVTGGSGSIGSELVRQIAEFKPAQIILFDRNENNAFFLEKEINKNFPEQTIIVRLGSVCDQGRVDAIFDETQPEVIYHTAANKHVPLSEANPSEAIQNNVFGTRMVARAAARKKALIFVLISTDKAVKPTSVMGTTKRIAEQYIQNLSKTCATTKFVTVRFGNVLGSSGSVIPIFKSQIAAGGPVKVTHPDMTRFFMTIPEASKLVLQSSVIGKSGDLFVLDMGESVKIIDLARKMIELSGFVPDIDIKIEFTGIRPGEKIYEELVRDTESSEGTSHPKIRNIVSNYIDYDFLEKMLDLQQFSPDTSPTILRAALMKIIVEATLKG